MQGTKYIAIIFLLALTANFAAMQFKAIVPLVSDGAVQVENPFCKKRFSTDSAGDGRNEVSETATSNVAAIQLAIPCTAPWQMPEAPVLSVTPSPGNRQITSFFQARYAFFNEVNSPPPRFV